MAEIINFPSQDRLLFEVKEDWFERSAARAGINKADYITLVADLQKSQEAASGPQTAASDESSPEPYLVEGHKLASIKKEEQ